MSLCGEVVECLRLARFFTTEVTEVTENGSTGRDDSATSR